MKTKKELLKELSVSRPDVAVKVTCSYDEDCCQHWEGAQTCDELIDEGFTPYMVKVEAFKIINGVIIKGDDHLGSCWMEHEGSDEEIGGYFEQMLQTALAELDENIEVYQV